MFQSFAQHGKGSLMSPQYKKNEESWMRGQQTCPPTIYFNPPSPWLEWCDEWRLTTAPGSTSSTLFEQWCGFFYVLQDPDKCRCCETGPTVLRPYPRRPKKSNRLQMSLQKQHFLLSYLKTLCVGLAELWTRGSRSADRRSPNWANQAATKPALLFL